MLKNFGCIFFLITILGFVPLNTLAAEILQVRSSSLLQIGDRNRSYTVKLACLEVAKSEEAIAVEFIKSYFKRGRRVNLKPIGSIDGVLLARVSSIDGNFDLAKKISDNNLGTLTC